MGRTVLIDADILAYQIASSQEKVYEFAGEHVLHANLDDGCREVDNAIAYIISHVDADGAVLMLTGKDNFRNLVLPSYKGNRVGTRRPMILSGLRQYMRDNYKTFEEENLEGDDLMGIHATMPHKGERVIYSADKDLKQIPGLHWCADDGEVIEVNQKDADRFFYQQVLTGDPTDNYKGLPGCGPVKAQKILDNAEAQDAPYWIGIVDAYQRAGLTEKDALVQARCARILRHGEYDFKTKKVHLWTPA